MGYNECYTQAVKTAVSLPDDLFRVAEATARKLRISRNQLYAPAIREFLDRRRTSEITARLNEIYAKEPAKLDPALNLAQLQSLKNNRW